MLLISAALSYLFGGWLAVSWSGTGSAETSRLSSVASVSGRSAWGHSHNGWAGVPESQTELRTSGRSWGFAVSTSPNSTSQSRGQPRFQGQGNKVYLLMEEIQGLLAEVLEWGSHGDQVRGQLLNFVQIMCVCGPKVAPCPLLASS